MLKTSKALRIKKAILRKALKYSGIQTGVTLRVLLRLNFLQTP
jgi:hypothetical protein